MTDKDKIWGEHSWKVGIRHVRTMEQSGDNETSASLKKLIVFGRKRFAGGEDGQSYGSTALLCFETPHLPNIRSIKKYSLELRSGLVAPEAYLPQR